MGDKHLCKKSYKVDTTYYENGQKKVHTTWFCLCGKAVK